MDLSVTFDSLNHELLIAKLKCHGLDQHSAEFSRRYLLEKNINLRNWRKIITGVPQRSILGL